MRQGDYHELVSAEKKLVFAEGVVTGSFRYFVFEKMVYLHAFCDFWYFVIKKVPTITVAVVFHCVKPGSVRFPKFSSTHQFRDQGTRNSHF